MSKQFDPPLPSHLDPQICLTSHRPMILPRFNLRTILAITTAAAVFFLLIRTGIRGQAWAWGAAIGILSLGVTALVHAACFGIVWCFARLSAVRSSDPRRDQFRTSAEEVAQ
jgi:hypothetical protein